MKIWKKIKRFLNGEPEREIKSPDKSPLKQQVEDTLTDAERRLARLEAEREAFRQERER